MQFHCIDPRVIPANMAQMSECAAECTNIFMLSESKMFWYVGNEKYNYRAFCSYACSLAVMPKEYMDNA